MSKSAARVCSFGAVRSALTYTSLFVIKSTAIAHIQRA